VCVCVYADPSHKTDWQADQGKPSVLGHCLECLQIQAMFKMYCRIVETASVMAVQPLDMFTV
jgi:hypothetical protein